MPNMTFTAVLVATMFLGSLASATNELHPSCRDRTDGIALNTNGSVTLTSTGYGTFFSLDCFSFVASIKHAGPGQCSPSMLPFSLFVLEGFNVRNEVRVRTDLVTATRGSLTGLSIHAEEPLRFFISAQNTYASAQCQMAVDWSMTAGYSLVKAPAASAPQVAETVPVVQAMTPTSAFTHSETHVVFQLPSSSAAAPSSADMVAVRDNVGCSGATIRGKKYSGVVAVVPATTPVRFTWSGNLTEVGGYLVCVLAKSHTEQAKSWKRLASVFVFGSNPAYFKSDQVSYSSQYQNQVELVFHGSALNPILDRVKLIDPTDSCAKATMTSNTQVSTPLQPAHQNHVSVVTATAFVSRAKMVRVCYFSAASRRWVVVPNFWSMSIDAKAAVRAHLTTVRTGSSEVTPHAPKGCVTAPMKANAARVDAVRVRLTKRASVVTHEIVHHLASFLCLPRDSIQVIERQGTIKTNSRYIFLRVRCDNTTVCFSHERMAFLVYAAKTAPFDARMAAFGVAAVTDTATNELIVGRGTGMNIDVLAAVKKGAGRSSAEREAHEKMLMWRKTAAVSLGCFIMLLVALSVTTVVVHRQARAVRLQAALYADHHLDDGQQSVVRARPDCDGTEAVATTTVGAAVVDGQQQQVTVRTEVVFTEPGVSPIGAGKAAAGGF
jgi:hypothetical protein